eukprot:Skav224971  [mRNA]  locus=scaffold3807:51871:53696:+ [translate_table: standard]
MADREFCVVEWEEPAADYDFPAKSPDQCCLPKLCKSSICSGRGNVLGSTEEECCSPKDCDDFTCSGKFAKKPKRLGADGRPVLQQGSTDEECCEPLSCKHVKCDATDQWVKNASATVGSTLEETCPDDQYQGAWSGPRRFLMTAPAAAAGLLHPAVLHEAQLRTRHAMGEGSACKAGKQRLGGA